MRADDPAGRAILEAAQALRAGRAPVLSPTHEVPGPEGIHRLPVEWFKAAGDGTNGPRLNKDAVTDFLKRWHAGVVCSTDLEPVSRTPLGTDLAAPEVAEPLGAAFRHVGRARILCVTRRGPSGVHAVNRALHAHTREHLGMPGGAFLPGEPVLVTENDYELNLFNGDQGLVVWLGGRRNADLHAVFQRSDGRYEAFPLAAVKARLEHAYALTVHKAQGSEYRRIAVVLPPEDMPLLSRELVYTALTRASKAVLVVGAAERLADAAARSEERHCGVGERLSGGR
jgi:exodeoxyribonuclease V alpha subunit